MFWYESSVFWGLFGVTVGALVTFLVSRHYAVKSTKQLDEVAVRLERQVNMLTRWADNFDGSPKFARDEGGEVSGVQVKLAASMSAGGDLRGNLADPDGLRDSN